MFQRLCTVSCVGDCFKGYAVFPGLGTVSKVMEFFMR